MLEKSTIEEVDSFVKEMEEFITILKVKVGSLIKHIEMESQLSNDLSDELQLLKDLYTNIEGIPKYEDGDYCDLEDFYNVKLAYIVNTFSLAEKAAPIQKRFMLDGDIVTDKNYIN